MTVIPDNSISPRALAHNFWFWALLITAFRIVTLLTAKIDLGPDESQYWYWAQDLDFGYFSKPPMIAWAIATTTSVFGDAEWAVRLSAPLFHFGAASFLYLAAQRIANQQVAFWAGLAWLTIPGVILSSLLITTDAPLLLFWSAALYAVTRIMTSNKAATADFVFLGAAIGFGLLSKYAMLYFLPGLAAAIALDSHLRQKLANPLLAISGILALALFTPNIIWNAAHDFSTVSHTAANANWGASLFKPLHLLRFLAGQFAIAGIVPVAALMFVFVRRKSAAIAVDDRRSFHLLIALALTPLIIVSIQAFISRAHANWAATAYPAAIILVTWAMFAIGRGWLAKASVLLHAAAMFIISVSVANLQLLDSVGLTAATSEVRGWNAQSAIVDSLGGEYDAIVIDDRPLMGAMLYYRQGSSNEMVALDPNANVDNHYEAFKAFDPARHRRVLFITTRDDAAHVDYRFTNIRSLGPIAVKIGGDETRTYHAFDISGYYGPGAP